MKQCNNKNSGFTLIEIIVVIGIVIVLSSIVFVNYRTAGQQFALQRSANKLAQDIRRTSEMAMSAREFQGVFPTGGYGIYLTRNENFYILYADTNGDQRFGGGDPIVETIYFEPGVYIKNISQINLSINFKPPNPFVKIEPGNLSNAFITLSLTTDLTKEINVRVNNVGLIEVE